MKYLLVFITCFSAISLFAQPVQSVRGTVVEELSGEPIPGVFVITLDSLNKYRTISDSLGNFVLEGLPVGRYDIKISAYGYEPLIIRELLVISAKQTIVSIRLKETVSELEEVEVRPHIQKDESVNAMSLVGSRRISMEEANRYAGGFDDPARLAASFAGVAGNTDVNGIIIRGNAPKYVQWKMEGIEIPNPNHFGDLLTIGGGTFTALSSQMLDNSDFLTGAFSAEYSNALSGVLDLTMRKGNQQKREYTFQAGLIGLDASSEGPFKKGGRSTYLFNYRYSTLALLTPLLPEDAGGLKFQDFSFNLNFPLGKKGVLSFWGIGLLDRVGSNAKTDSTKWEHYDDKETNEIHQYAAASGLRLKYFFKENLSFTTTLGTTVNGTNWDTDSLNPALSLVPKSRISTAFSTLVLNSYLNKTFNSRHTNKTGVIITTMFYDLSLKQTVAQVMKDYVQTSGTGSLLTMYTQSVVSLGRKWRMNAGLNAQYFTLSQHYTIEPRVSFILDATPKQQVGLAYGLHSRLERLNYYLNNSVITGEVDVNKRLDFSKAHHLVLSYKWRVGKLMTIHAEPYFQYLFAVPVVNQSSYSILNAQNEWFFSEKLENKGKGRNYGVDVTVEKYISNGFYFLVTGSLFRTEYQGGDKVWRSTRFDRQYVTNLLCGKEWATGKQRQNSFGINVRLSFQGGNRYSPINEMASAAIKAVVLDESKAYSMKSSPATLLHLTFSYKINKEKSSGEWSLKLLNVTRQPDFNGFQYNLQTNTVDKNLTKSIVPNLSYKLSF